ncbi:MAG TPA: hypothetical protein VK324_15020 [Tepidisphaeraceae bacterium]|nr:hypothetical protein [Tepidisphaeraceae bacterium]
MHARFGELLGRLVQLSPHDVHEILAEQQGTRLRFGEIALRWGLCQPEHVWRAWAQQAVEDQAVVDLDVIGVDAQAVTQLPYDVAKRLCVIAVRSFEHELVVAVDAERPVDPEELARASKKSVRIVRADGRQIRDAIDTYYPAA